MLLKGHSLVKSIKFDNFRTVGNSIQSARLFNAQRVDELVVLDINASRQNGLSVISMTGFEGGRTAGLAHVNLHVTANNYGVIEDVHQSLMHLLGQFMRQKRMSADLITQRKF